MSRAARTLAFCGLAGLAACDVAHPFERLGSEGELGAPPIPVLCVEPIPHLPAPLAQALRAALAEELVRREYLAAATDPCPSGSPRIMAWETTTDGIPRLTFSRPSEGRANTPITVSLEAPADPALWPDTAERWAAYLAERLRFFPPAVRSVREPFENLLDARLKPTASPVAPVPVAADHPDRIFVETVEGATGDGNTLLRFAMLGYLRRTGLKPDTEAATRDGAPYLVKGRVDIGPPRGEKNAPKLRRVRIVWTVSDAKGRTLGSLEQANDIPAESLDRIWGQAADAVAAAAAGGIAEMVRQARADAPPPGPAAPR
jgi:hypothetical protein